jgi:beta-glucanase (GH16 family)
VEPTDTSRRPVTGRILRSGIVAIAAFAGISYVVAREPAGLQLAQAEGEAPSDACGTRPARPPADAPTTPTPATSSTTTTAPPASSTSLTSPSFTSPSAVVPDTVTEAAGTGYWDCTLAEDFDGTALDRSRWLVQTTTKGNFGVGGECFVDSPNNIDVSGGTLKLTIRQEPASIPCPRASNYGFSTPFTAGSIITTAALDQTYGRYEIRARMPDVKVPGIQFSFWLWPRDLTTYPVSFGQGDSDKWTNGELDVVEWYSRYPYHDVPYIHYAHTYVQAPSGQWVPNDPNLTTACLVGTTEDWHTYALEWTPTSIRMLFDGKVCLENTHWTPRNTTMPGPFDQPFMVSLTQALGAIGTQNQLVAQTPLPATTEVDYLKIWH